MKLKSLSLLIVIFSLSKFAYSSDIGIAWSDPKDILLATDEFVGWTSFETAFHDGQEIKMIFKECITLTTCTEQTSLTKIKSVSNYFEILTYNESGNLISKDKITEDTWNSWAGNTLRATLHQLEGAGYQVEIQSLATNSIDIEVNGNKKTFETRTVEVFGKNFLGATVKSRISLAQDLTGLAQRVFKSDLLSTGNSYREWKIISVSDN